MTWITKLFSSSLKLYPVRFRVRFAAEMEEVFSSGLSESRKEGALVGYLLREILKFPLNLAGVYLWSMQTGEGRQLAVSGAGNGNGSGVSMQGESWKASFMAGLPHLLMALFIIGSNILYWKMGGIKDVYNYMFGFFIIILVLGVVIYSRVRGWKSWSATWLVYIFGISLALLVTIGNTIDDRLSSYWSNVIQFVILPLLLAYLLYKIACKDRSWGLLAAIAPAVLIWTIFEEFVRSLHTSLASGWIFLLAFSAAVFIVRTTRLSTKLMLAMAVPILGGFPFVYLGIYEGGSLPFTAPGPNMVEVIKQYLPILAVSLAMILGPQLAVKLRESGHRNSNQGGKIYYRLALGGILIGLIFSMAETITINSGTHIDLTISKGLLVISLILFLVGYALLAVTANYNKSLPDNHGEVLELAALFFPLFFVPAVLLVATAGLAGNYLDYGLILFGEMIWVISAFLVVRD